MVCYTGDGGMQVNIQELHTVKRLRLDVAIVVINNGCYGTIKQFQDSYLRSCYTASQDGYSTPDLRAVAEAYGLKYRRIDSVDQISPDLFRGGR